MRGPRRAVNRHFIVGHLVESSVDLAGVVTSLTFWDTLQVGT
jgi:hypothetical protein